jgi:hypothetical protein
MDPVFAVSLAGTIEKIGAYAGFAAIPGLAVLALLCFAQAREVRRLREWAGRAPERAQELQARVSGQAASGRRVTSQPIAGRPGTAAARAGAGAEPPQGRGQPARPSPATPSPQAARPAPSGASPGPPQPGARPPERPQGGPGAAAQPGPAAATVATTGTRPDQGPSPGSGESSAAASQAGGGTPAGAPPSAQRAGADNHHEGKPTSGPRVSAARDGATAGTGASAASPLRMTRRTATLPRTPPEQGPYVPRRLPSEAPGAADRGRRRGVAVAAAVAVLAAVGLAVVVISGTAGGGSHPAGTAAQAGPAGAAAPSRGPVVRNRTTVAVLNGTTVPGLAARVANDLERGGFRRGSVTNAADQQRPSTTVDYAPGYQRAAREVGAMLKVRHVVPIDAGTQAIAGPEAGVVVTVGTDRTR